MVQGFGHAFLVAGGERFEKQRARRSLGGVHGFILTVSCRGEATAPSGQGMGFEIGAIIRGLFFKKRPMAFGKKSGPSAVALWWGAFLRAAQAMGGAIKANGSEVVWVGKCVSKALAAMGLAVLGAHWCLPWLGAAGAPEWVAWEQKIGEWNMLEIKGPLPTARQWSLAHALVGDDLNCAVEAAKVPGFGGSLYMSNSCSSRGEVKSLMALQAFFQEERSRAEQEKRANELPELFVEAAREHAAAWSAAMEKERDGQERVAEEERERLLDQRLAFGIARKLRQGVGIEEAASEALKEMGREQAQEGKARQESLEAARDPSAREKVLNATEGRVLSADHRGGRVGGLDASAEALAVKGVRSQEDVEKIQALRAVGSALTGKKVVVVSGSALRQALSPAALWSNDAAASAELSAARSPEMVGKMRGRGLELFLGFCFMGALCFYCFKPLKRLMASVGRATEELRKQAFPHWEAKQMGKAAKSCKSGGSKSRL